MENLKIRTCGGPYTQHYFSIPSLLGFALGLIAIKKNKPDEPVSLVNEAQTVRGNDGKRLAILGVIAGVPGLLLAIASLPSCSLQICRIGRETAPINRLRTIHQNQATYYATLSRFATLEELAAFGLMDPAMANGRLIYGYVYSSSDVTAETYCVHADRVNDKCGNRDFIICEDGVIRFIESERKGTVRRGEGTSISEVSR